MDGSHDGWQQQAMGAHPAGRPDALFRFDEAPHEIVGKLAPPLDTSRAVIRL